jgi:DNA-binding PadR family transcriptional regulator
MLSRGPKNGAEIMNSIEDMTQGWWRPSPGSIYPLLESLVQEGLIKKAPDGKYELTEESRKEIEWPIGMPGAQPQNIQGMLQEMNGYVSYFEDLSKSDPTKMAPHRGEVRKIAERLQSLTSDGGEKA